MNGVFAGGDAYYGPKTVVEAIGCGKEASVSIDRYLKELGPLYGQRAERCKADRHHAACERKV